jgi:hypothetical protein
MRGAKWGANAGRHQPTRADAQRQSVQLDASSGDVPRRGICALQARGHRFETCCARQVVQLHDLIETLILDPVTTAGNHRCILPGMGKASHGCGASFDREGARRCPEATDRAAGLQPTPRHEGAAKRLEERNVLVVLTGELVEELLTAFVSVTDCMLAPARKLINRVDSVPLAAGADRRSPDVPRQPVGRRRASRPGITVPRQSAMRCGPAACSPSSPSLPQRAASRTWVLPSPAPGPPGWSTTQHIILIHAAIDGDQLRPSPAARPRRAGLPAGKPAGRPDPHGPDPVQQAREPPMTDDR